MTNQTVVVIDVALETYRKKLALVSQPALTEERAIEKLMTQIIWPVRSSCFGSWRRRETRNGRRTDGEYM